MKYAISLDERELEELDELLHAELSERRVELRRTRNPGFRAFIRGRMDLDRGILQQIDHALDNGKWASEVHEPQVVKKA